MLRLLILTLIAIAVAMVLLCVRIISKKDGTFSSQHISENKKMKENGIGCATSQDRKAQRATKTIDVKAL